MIQEQTCEATEEELKKEHRRCWSPHCKNKAFLQDSGGWQWCAKHLWENYRWGGGERSLQSFYYLLKSTKLF